MRRGQKTERSRRAVLDAGLELFSKQGFGATTVRQIAEHAQLSVGNVYHHFPDKQGIFLELIDEYFAITATARFPFTRVLRSSIRFPDNLEELALAARESVRQYRPYLALIYVDVVEFGGTHIQQFYTDMSERFEHFFRSEGQAQEVTRRLRPGVAPASAMLLTTRVFFNHFIMEILFGVAPPAEGDVVHELADMIRNGIAAQPAS